MIDQTLPATVSTAYAYTDADPAQVLLPEEEPFVARAVDKRRREFATVRACARRALAEQNVAPVPILPGERGAPQFPDGISGALTHCDGYRAAAIARALAFPGLGIDAEPALPMPDGMIEAVSLPRERRWVAELDRRYPAVPWGRLLFSAKESVYKVWYPLMRTELGFEDALINFSPLTGTFDVRLYVPGLAVDGQLRQELTGRWLCAQGLLVTSIAVSAAAAQCADDVHDSLVLGGGSPVDARPDLDAALAGDLDDFAVHTADDEDDRTAA